MSGDTNTVKEFTEEEVSKHNSDKDCWLIIGNDSNGGGKVYDVTKYLEDHPGGSEVMLEYAGKDADSMFEDIGHSSEARNVMKKYFIGNLKAGAKAPGSVTKTKTKTESSQSSGGLNPIVLVVLIVAIIAGIFFTQKQ